MKTEISRDSHQPEKRYSGVYQQQGRMLVDADWNELVDILKSHADDALKDVVGNDSSRVGGTPRHRGLQVAKAVAGDVLTVHPGHVYVNGMRGEVAGDGPLAYDEQPDFPEAPQLAGNCRIYADVWERTVTQLLDARLRDVALHGADTTTRKQTMVQVKWCPTGLDPERSPANPTLGNALLSLELHKKSGQEDPCDPCAEQLDIRTRVGNYLYRVEVHDVSGDAHNPDAITLKWSSENGAEQFVALSDRSAMPEGFLGDGWVYEFFDEISERHLGVHLDGTGWQPVRGTLTEIREPLAPYEVPVVSGVADVPVLVRRWDGFCELDLTGAGALERGWDGGARLSATSAAGSRGHVSLASGNLNIVLENVLLELELSSKSLVAGDYWIVDVREILHDPSDPNANTLLDRALPGGIEHRYLTLGDVIGGVLADDPERDRKFAFPPLTEMTRIFQAGGDGQEVMPGEPLAQPLRVGVANGEWPVVGATVRFTVEEGDDAMTPADGLVVTDSAGIAECGWSPGSDAHTSYRIKGSLVDPDDPGRSTAPPVYFYANMVTADQVAYEPGCDGASGDDVHSLLVDDPAVGLATGGDYYTVAEVMDALLCRLRAKHIPYDATNVARWEDVNAEEQMPLPRTVQQAIDALLENLHSEDITYTPDCPAETLPSVRSLLGVSNTTSSRVHEVFNKLLCDFNATQLPVDRDDLCGYLEGRSGSDRVETVQDAINALCQRESGGCCDITIVPGDDIEARLTNEIPPGGDAHICVKHGEYRVARPLLLKGFGHITLEGCGFESVIRAVKSEAAVVFADCERVVVRNLSMRTDLLGDKRKTEFDHLNGALTVSNVNEVVVEHVSLRCPHAGRKMGSCLTVAHESATDSVRVRDCRLDPGHEQVGMLIVNARRAWIENNEIQVRRKTKNMTLKTFVRDKDYRLSLRKIILSDAIVVPRGAAPDPKRNLEFAYERRTLRFRTVPGLAPEWQKLLSGNPIEAGLNDRDLLRQVTGIANTILLHVAEDRDPPFAGVSGAFNDWFKVIANQLPAIASQAIVCAGIIAGDLTISGNVIHGARQGIHVGLSHRAHGKMYRAGRVMIKANRIRSYLSEQVLGERHGIFVGNFETLHVEENHLELKTFPANLDVDVSGIKVFGLFGEMLQIRGNRLRGFRAAIYARAVVEAVPEVQLWQVENNLLLESAGTDPDLWPPNKFIATNNPS